jgi:type IV pilus biogenesis protein CpaD/CtpE
VDDWCSEEGARELARRIRKYWKDRGYKVDVRVETQIASGRKGDVAPVRSGFVRSNLLNALPREVTA